MNMKGLIAATLVVIVPASLHAQEPLIPQNFLQTAPEAYYHYEPKPTVSTAGQSANSSTPGFERHRVSG